MATAWGEIVMNVAETGAGDAMGTSLVSLGFIQEDTLEITTEEGERIQLFATGHVLVDQLQLEDTLTVNCSLIGIAKATQFWDLDGTSKVQSLVNSTDWSVEFTSKVVGSDTFEAPKCRIKATPQFSEKEGWTVDLTITALMGEAGYLFEFGTVPE